MLTEKEFEKKIWEKYNNEKIYNKNINIMNIKKIVKVASISIATIIGTSGMIYVGAMTYDKYIQKTSSSYYKTGLATEMFKDIDFKYQSDFYYRKIDNYSEYLLCKEKLSNLVEANESDFTNNFIIVIIAEHNDMPGLKITNISNEENSLNIEVDKSSNEKTSKDYEGIVSSLLNKNIERDTINITKKIYQTSNSNYIDIKELPKDYTMEEAKKDNCIILNDAIASENDKKRINDFITNTQNKKEDFIRIVKLETEDDEQRSLTIIDLQYKDNKYNFCIDSTRKLIKSDDVNDYYYNSFNNISKKYLEMYDETFVFLDNSPDSNQLIFAYK